MSRSSSGGRVAPTRLLTKFLHNLWLVYSTTADEQQSGPPEVLDRLLARRQHAYLGGQHLLLVYVTT